MDIESAIYDPKLLDKCIEHVEGFEGLSKNFQIRPLELDDFSKGYCDLLSRLTQVGDVSMEQFQSQFNAMKNCKNTYFITVVEDLAENKIVATTTVVKELKFIHETGTRWRIEDVVVHESCRGKGLAKLLIKVGVKIAEHVGGYKVSLECTEDLIPFYSKCGLKTNKNQYLELRF